MCVLLYVVVVDVVAGVVTFTDCFVIIVVVITFVCL